MYHFLMDVKEEAKQFVHSISNDLVIIEGYLRFSLEDMSDDELRHFQKAYNKLEGLINKVHDFRASLDK